MASDDDILDMIFNPDLAGAGFQPRQEVQLPQPTAPAIPAELLTRLRELETRAILAAEAAQKRATAAASSVTGDDAAGASSASAAAADSSSAACAATPASSDAAAAAASSPYAESLALLRECISLCPSYASAHNNLAQVLQLAREPAEALSACDRAVSLATESGDKVVLAQALTQRGLLRRRIGAGDEKQEELALGDLQRAGALGNAYARAEAVRLNPYSALCNQYLQMALEKHWSGLGSSGEKAATTPAATESKDAAAAAGAST